MLTYENVLERLERRLKVNGLTTKPTKEELSAYEETQEIQNHFVLLLQLLDGLNNNYKPQTRVTKEIIANLIGKQVDQQPFEEIQAMTAKQAGLKLQQRYRELLDRQGQLNDKHQIIFRRLRKRAAIQQRIDSLNTFFSVDNPLVSQTEINEMLGCSLMGMDEWVTLRQEIKTIVFFCDTKASLFGLLDNSKHMLLDVGQYFNLIAQTRLLDSFEKDVKKVILNNGMHDIDYIKELIDHKFKRECVRVADKYIDDPLFFSAAKFIKSTIIPETDLIVKLEVMGMNTQIPKTADEFSKEQLRLRMDTNWMYGSLPTTEDTRPSNVLCPGCAAVKHWVDTFNAPNASIHCTPDHPGHTCGKYSVAPHVWMTETDINVALTYPHPFTPQQILRMRLFESTSQGKLATAIVDHPLYRPARSFAADGTEIHFIHDVDNGVFPADIQRYARGVNLLLSYKDSSEIRELELPKDVDVMITRNPTETMWRIGIRRGTEVYVYFHEISDPAIMDLAIKEKRLRTIRSNSLYGNVPGSLGGHISNILRERQGLKEGEFSFTPKGLPAKAKLSGVPGIQQPDGRVLHISLEKDEPAPEEIQSIADNVRQSVLSGKHLTKLNEGQKEQLRQQMESDPETGFYHDTPLFNKVEHDKLTQQPVESYGERKQRLNGVSGLTRSHQPLFNVVEHEKLMQQQSDEE